MKQAPIDLQLSHRHHAVSCFNEAWDLLDLPARSEAQAEELIHLAHASLFHWTRVEGHTPTNRSVGLWQLSRAHAVAGNYDRAHHYAELCLEASRDPSVEPFYLGYAHEALARASSLLGHADEATRHLEAAGLCLQEVAKVEDREALRRDLASISSRDT